MNRNSKNTIEAIAIIEKGDFNEVVPPWIVSPLAADSYFTNIRIYEGINDKEIGSVMLVACLSSSVESSKEIIKETALETLEIFVADEGFVLSGGLEFKENEKVVMSPKCCCGLEDWETWLDVSEGETQIWNGHDPFASVEISDGKIKIWRDEKLKNESPSIEFSVDEFIENMKSVQKDLKDFLVRLAQWTKDIVPQLEKQVVNHFAKNMCIEL